LNRHAVTISRSTPEVSLWTTFPTKTPKLSAAVLCAAVLLWIVLVHEDDVVEAAFR
jgi:hypothetical protein